MDRSRQALRVGGVLLLLVCVFVILWWYLPGPFPSPRKNGYSEFLQAAAVLPKDPPDYSDQAALAEFVSRSSAAYAHVERGLQNECVVTVKASEEWEAQHNRREVPALKALTHALVAKAKLAELAGRREAALAGYITAYRFAAAIGHGGLALDYLNSLSCEALVIGHCRSLISTLVPEEKVELLRSIKVIETARERPGVAARRTHRWQRMTFGFRAQLQTWERALLEVWKTRSWAPFSTLRRKLTQKTSFFEQQYAQPLCLELSKTPDRQHGPSEPRVGRGRGEAVGP